MVSPYSKPYADLTEEERDLVDTAQQVLRDGNQLYGIAKNDISHIEYAVGFALKVLGDLYEGDAIATVIEIGIDDDGHFITFLMNRDTIETEQ